MPRQLKPDMADLLQALVVRGRYESEDAALDAAMRLLQEREARRQRLKRDIEIGIESGPGEAGSFAEVARRARVQWGQQVLPGMGEP
jgi:putative addiction module CopG family antidote